jgi:PAS domain S-box-containing protein
LLVHDLETSRGGRPAQLLALAAALIPLQALIGYAYGVEPLRGVAAHTHVAFHSGLGHAFLCTALLLDRPERGIVRVFASAGMAGFMARRLVAAIVFLPLVLGWLFLVAGLRLGQYETLLGASFVVVSAIVVGVAVVWWNALALEELEGERSRAEQTERRQREWLRTTLASIGDAVIATDMRARVSLLNSVAEKLTGWRQEEAAGRPLDEVFRAVREESRARIDDPVGVVFRSKAVTALPPRTLLLARGGGEHPIGGSAAPIQEPGGEVLGVVLVVSDMTERRRSEEDRAGLFQREQAARAEAESANRAKDEFIATVSHELRTPLNAVLGWARLLRSGKLDADSTGRAIEAIERSATTQAQIVDDLLDVSRIVRGQLRLDVRPVDLVPVIEAAVDTVRPAAAARNISIAASLASKAGPVSGDPGRLQQVAWNLLSNAIKFTPAGGRVEVRLEQLDDQVRVQVSDTGAGIDPQFLPHVFERFRQADSSSTRAHGGLGLGLAIARHLVEAHGGTVAAESQGRGRGATFTVSLPIAAQHARAMPAEASRQPPPAPEARRRRAPSLDALRVLIVDDDADTLEVVRELLEQAGARVTAASSVTEALTCLQDSPPDVLVSDIGMPGEDGFSLIKKVRGLAPERGGRVPAAALTAYTQSEDRRQALQAGYQAYLSKPIDPSELTAAVARLAGRAR